MQQKAKTKGICLNSEEAEAMIGTSKQCILKSTIMVNGTSLRAELWVPW